MVRRRRGLLVLGIAVLVVGVVGGFLLWVFAGKRYDDAVADLAPAPIGCDTTLTFDKTGTFTMFIETKGHVGEIDGDCDADDRSYDIGDDDPPRVSLTLLDDDGDEVDLDRATGPDYDRGGAKGSGYRTVQIVDTGDYVLSADAVEDAVMIRVGRDPTAGVAAMRIGGVLVFLAGLVGGIVAVVASRPRPPKPVSPASGSVTPWTPIGIHPRPTAPPYANPPVPPPYAAPPRPWAGAADEPPPRGGPPGAGPVGGSGAPHGGRPLPPPPPPPPPPPSGRR